MRDPGHNIERHMMGFLHWHVNNAATRLESSVPNLNTMLCTIKITDFSKNLNGQL
jgi:hypothetical protein